MKHLAWIEILNHHGDVKTRQPVYAWPLNIGRGYHNDVILDDPYIAPGHLEIQPAELGGYQLNILGDAPALTINQQRDLHQSTQVSAEDIIHLGKTSFRIRPIDYVVTSEMPIPKRAWLRPALGLFLGISLILLEYALVRWLNYTFEQKPKMLIIDMLDMLPWWSGFTWIGFWAALSRVEVGHPHIIKHATIATLGFGSIYLITDIYGYIAFALDAELVSVLTNLVLLPFITGFIVYRHICLASRLNRRKVGLLVAAVMIFNVGITELKDNWRSEDDFAQMIYSRTVGSPAMVLTAGETPAKFIADTKELKAITDESVKDEAVKNGSVKREPIKDESVQEKP
ncbi:MAG: FHA domain-containing protein [Gallionella sp.]|nr:FHA domain-containing protein [Gallionella sp.]